MEGVQMKLRRPHVCICTLVSCTTPQARGCAMALDLFLGSLWLGS